MDYIQRKLMPSLTHHLQRGKSVLLLGARQVGKTTLLRDMIADLSFSLIERSERLRLEKNPELLKDEVRAIPKKCPLVIIDEVQKVPELMDVAQDLIDSQKAQFILTGSSARKLKRGPSAINLLPGRVVKLQLDPLSLAEIANYQPNIEQVLYYGTLPAVFLTKSKSDREIDLESYTTTYLEEEVRAEALVRKLGDFARFIEFAGLESGRIINASKIAEELGIGKNTITSYFQILYDCLIAERIDPLTRSSTRKRLVKSSLFLVFDLGVRRLCAGEGSKLGNERLGELFEQFVGLELIRHARISDSRVSVKFWRDANGPEVDYVLDTKTSLVPIEVKWSAEPHKRAARHLQTFIDEYDEATHGYVVCKAPRRFQLTDHVLAMPWQEIPSLFKLVPPASKM